MRPGGEKETTMALLIFGLILFLGVHSVPIATGLRQQLVSTMGEVPFKAVFSVISLAGLVLVVMGYSQLRASEANVVLWDPPTWMSHISLLLMILAMIALVAAYVPSNIRNVLKHPMLVAIKIWALAHLLANGDLASLLLFGTFLAWAVVDRISVKRREALGPLGAREGSLAGDAIVVVVGLAAYAALAFYAHEWLFGVPPLPALAT